MNSVDAKPLALRLSAVGVSYKVKTGLLKSSLHWALNDISFAVHQGEILGVIGGNGAGKSTLLRLLSGIVAPDRGVFEDFGNMISLLALNVGFIPHLSGRKNAVLSGMMLGMSRSEVVEKLPEILDFSELGASIDQPAWTYSTGMRLRLGFAVAFQADPDVILIDEALGVGDKVFREKSSTAMRDKILSNKTIVVVSHNMKTIKELCDRVVWVEGGSIRMIGKTTGVVREYQRRPSRV